MTVWDGFRRRDINFTASIFPVLGKISYGIFVKILLNLPKKAFFAIRRMILLIARIGNNIRPAAAIDEFHNPLSFGML